MTPPIFSERESYYWLKEKDVIKMIDEEMEKTKILFEKTGMLKIKQKLKEMGKKENSKSSYERRLR